MRVNQPGFPSSGGRFLTCDWCSPASEWLTQISSLCSSTYVENNLIPILSFLLTGSPSLPTHGLSQTNQISSRLWGSCQGLCVLIYSDLAAKLLMKVQQRPICSWSPQESSLFSMRLRPGPSCGSRAALPASCGGPAGTRCRARRRWHWGDLRWCWGCRSKDTTGPEF